MQSLSNRTTYFNGNRDQHTSSNEYINCNQSPPKNDTASKKHCHTAAPTFLYIFTYSNHKSDSTAKHYTNDRIVQ